MNPSRGRIVWVEIPDPRGENPKKRPAVILTPDHEITPEGEILLAAVTSQVDSVSGETAVTLPWHREGKTRTGLRSPSVVVCKWLVTIKVADVREYGGTVPGKELREILEKVATLSA